MGYSVRIKGDESLLERTWDFVHFLCIQHGMKEEEADVYSVAIGEAYTNAIQYSKDEPGENNSELILYFEDEEIVAKIINKGDLIDFENINAFNTHQDFLQYSAGKLGIPLIKTVVDDVVYERINGKNIVTLIRKFCTENNK